PRRRWTLVAGAEEFVRRGDRETGISTQIYEKAVFPEGDAHLARFALSPFPVWTYQADDWEVERSLCLARDRSVTIVRYVNRGSTEIGLRIRPLLRFRGSGELQRETAELDPAVEVRGEISWVRPVPYLPRLYLRAVGFASEPDPVWSRGSF